MKGLIREGLSSIGKIFNFILRSRARFILPRIVFDLIVST
jgi:hypothetical protein